MHSNKRIAFCLLHRRRLHNSLYRKSYQLLSIERHAKYLERALAGTCTLQRRRDRAQLEEGVDELSSQAHHRNYCIAIIAANA